MRNAILGLALALPLILGCPGPGEDKADPALPRFTVEVKGMT